MKIFYYVNAPVLEMRKEPHKQAEVVSQGIFSEEIQILEEKSDWIRVKTLVDQYSGWTKKTGICSRIISYGCEAEFTNVIICRLSAHLYEAADTIYGPLLTLPYESRLLIKGFKEENSRWLTAVLPDGRSAYIQRGDVVHPQPSLDKKSLGHFSKKFLDLPYTWGGRTSFGYDCSGLIQMLYRHMGIFLPRDSQEQFVDLRLKDSPIEDLESGDLIFWGHSKEQIRHVGLALGNGHFIHTSAVTENKPYVRMSHTDDKAWNGSGHYSFLAGKRLITTSSKFEDQII